MLVRRGSPRRDPRAATRLVFLPVSTSLSAPLSSPSMAPRTGDAKRSARTAGRPLGKRALRRGVRDEPRWRHGFAVRRDGGFEWGRYTDFAGLRLHRPVGDEKTICSTNGCIPIEHGPGAYDGRAGPRRLGHGRLWNLEPTACRRADFTAGSPFPVRVEVLVFWLFPTGSIE